MRINTMTAAATALLFGVLPTGPAMAQVYNVVFAGKIVPVDCPESPEGHTMTWVSQNCTAVRVAPFNTSTLDAARDGTLFVQKTK